MSLRVLITGFEIFDGYAANPSGEIALDLDCRIVTAMSFTPAAPGSFAPSTSTRTATVRSFVLPVVWATAGPLLISHMTTWHPHIAISLGMAPGDADFRVESTAHDFNPLTSLDNHHVGPAATRTHPEEPATPLLTTLPIQRILDAIRSTGVTARESSSAGAFLCEDVFYELMLYYRRRGAAAQLFRAGFIHVPYDTTAGAYRVGTRAAYVRAIEAAIRATISDLTPAEYATAASGP